MKKYFLLLSLLFVLICGTVTLTSFSMKSEVAFSRNDTLSIVIPKGWPKPVYDFKKNPITKNGFDLGKDLFFDPLLSKDSSTSCASCHLQFTNFTHVDHALSHGIYGKKGNRNTLAIINTAWSKNFMWDGGANNIEVQPLAPISNPVEMDSDLESIVKRLEKSQSYLEKFKKAFGPKAEITGQYVLKALAQYMLRIQSYNSKYDKVMRKEPGISFTENEAKGLALFRKNCASCHTEPLFTNNSFENNGLPVDPDLKDSGRMKITGNKTDSLKFKVPSLRNIEVSYPYMHDGRFRNLQMVLFHYSNGISQSPTLPAKLKNGIALNEQDKNNLVAFLKTLTDQDFLRNRELYYSKE
jgi:cytochrome c peroxidase